MHAENVIYFYSFAIEHVLKQAKKVIGNKNLITNIYRIQAYNSIMCGCFCTKLVDFMLNVCLIIQIYLILMIMTRMIK